MLLEMQVFWSKNKDGIQAAGSVSSQIEKRGQQCRGAERGL